MKRMFIALLLAAATLPVHAEETDAKTVSAKITEVTVYADRARVTRVASNAPLGGKLAFTKLPGWLDEGSVRVSITPAGAGELLDVQVLKTFLARPDDEEIRKAEAAVQEMSDQIAALDDEKTALDAQSRQVDAIRAFSLEKLPKDTAVREIKVDEYNGVVKFVGSSLLEVAKGKRALEKKRRDLQPELTARQRRLEELHQRAQLEQRTIVVATRAKAPTATVTLTYMLPGATWEPVHELRADGNNGAVTIASYGSVTQTTGEDWDGVALALSTQRPMDTMKIPELESLFVGADRPLPQMTARSVNTFDAANRNFTKQVRLWNTYANAPAQQVEFESNWAVQQAAQGKNVEKFEALQEKRGTTAHFAAAGTQTIRTDGRQVRVPIGTAQLTAAPKIVAAPELSLNAVRTAELVNTSKQPLLPGRVLLYLEGAFLGTTDVDFVAPGESFPMFMGLAEQIKLSRVLDKKQSSMSWSGRRTRIQASFIITAENLSDKEVKLELADRVPVSQTDEVRVLNVRITPSMKPDNKGLFHWDATIGAKQKSEFRVEYLIDYPSDLLDRPVSQKGAATAAPADALHEQIRDLKSKF